MIGDLQIATTWHTRMPAPHTIIILCEYLQLPVVMSCELLYVLYDHTLCTPKGLPS